MHNIYIRAQKDSTKQWMKVPFLAIDDAIFNFLEAWLPKWHAPNIAELERSIAHKKENDVTLCIAQLAEKRQKETTTAEVQAVWEATQKVAE